MKIADCGVSILIAACALSGCGSGARRGQGSQLSLYLSSSGSADGADALKIEMRAAETRTVVLVAAGAEGPVTFGGRDLPAFAKLDGPILTLAPQRADAGDHAFVLTVMDDHGNSEAKLLLTVLRPNTPPVWKVGVNSNGEFGLGDNTNWYRIACPIKATCTAAPNSFLLVQACDNEGDGITAEVEVVPRGQTFAKKATFFASIPAVYPPPPNGNCALINVYMPGLIAEQSYDFAVRVLDQFGAVGVVPGAPDGWFYDSRMGFDQGPCVTRQCACRSNAAVDPVPWWATDCMADIDCCSGVCDKTKPGFFPATHRCK